MGFGYLYESTDTDAPVLQTSVGSFTALLQAILVDGYGAKAPLGWTLEYTRAGEPSCKVFRGNPATGTGHFFRVDSSDANKAKIDAYEFLNGWDSHLVHRCPDAEDNFLWVSYQYCYSNPVEWKLIGDENCFLFLWKPYTNHNSRSSVLWTMAFVGDYTAFNSSLKWNSCLIGYISNYVSNPYVFFPDRFNSVSDINVQVMRTMVDFEYEPTSVTITGVFSTMSAFRSYIYAKYDGSFNLGGGIIAAPVFISDHGLLPGVYDLPTHENNLYRMSDWDTFTDDWTQAESSFQFNFGDHGFFVLAAGNGATYNFFMGFRYGEGFR